MIELSDRECAVVAVVIRAQMEGRAMHVRELSPELGDLLLKLTRAAGGAETVIEAGGAEYAAAVQAGVDGRPVPMRQWSAERATRRLDHG